MEVTVPRTSRFRSTLRGLAFLSLVLLLFPSVYILWGLTLERQRARIVWLFYKACARITGLKVTLEGNVSRDRPLMLIANHSSYLDIFVLGSLMPLCFTPKREIRSWPIIGFFCVLADCVFIERRAGDMQRAQKEMEEKLRAGKVIALFPEGTTGDGFHVKPFKSGFLSLIEEHNLPLQPVSVAYTHIGDIPLNAANRDHVAWIGEASFVTHFVRLIRYPSVSVTLRCHEVQSMENYEDRKELAKACENIIRTGLHDVLGKNGVTS